MVKAILFAALLGQCLVLAVLASPTKPENTYKEVAVGLLNNCAKAGKTMAVADFSYSDARDSLDGGVVAERITTELVKLDKFKIIERKEMEKVFKELRFQRSGAIDAGSIKDIGKMLGADWVVVGTLTELPNKKLELNARMVNVESGEILNAVQVSLVKDWLNQYRVILAEQNKAIETKSKNRDVVSINSPEVKLKDTELYYERGITYSDLGEYDNAIASFGIAIIIDAGNAKNYMGRGYAYYLNSEYDKAIEDYSKAISIDPQNTDAYYKRGVINQLKGDIGKAIEDFSKAIATSPKQADLYFSRGSAYQMKGKESNALSDYSKCIELDPRNAGAYYARAMIYMWQRNEAKAREDYYKAVGIDAKYDAAEYKYKIIVLPPLCYDYVCLSRLNEVELKAAIASLADVYRKQLIAEARKKFRFCYSQRETDNLVIPPEIKVDEGERKLMEYMCNKGMFN